MPRSVPETADGKMRPQQQGRVSDGQQPLKKSCVAFALTACN
jgi:hypothetical protein